VAGALIVEEDVGEVDFTILEALVMRSQEMELTQGEDFVEVWTEIGLRVPFPQQPAFLVTYGHSIDPRCVFVVLCLGMVLGWMVLGHHSHLLATYLVHQQGSIMMAQLQREPHGTSLPHDH
jgi:hypothetical protein